MNILSTYKSIKHILEMVGEHQETYRLLILYIFMSRTMMIENQAENHKFTKLYGFALLHADFVIDLRKNYFSPIKETTGRVNEVLGFDINRLSRRGIEMNLQYNMIFQVLVLYYRFRFKNVTKIQEIEAIKPLAQTIPLYGIALTYEEEADELMQEFIYDHEFEYRDME